jgi:hypothetical protein
MKNMNKGLIQEFLARLGSRYPKQATLYLLGGSALILLGSSRDTLDIDYVGNDMQKDDFQILIEEIAAELELETEPVPIERFIPLPEGNDQRKIHIGQFGNVDAYIVDPYSIALSKVDRGFETDLEDIVFLIRHNQINMEELEQIIKNSLSRAGKFDFHPEILAHFEDLKKRLK